jgi:integrase
LRIYQLDPRRPVFTDEIGVQLSPKAATNAFVRIATKAGIGTTSLHSTRHTAATHLIARRHRRNDDGSDSRPLDTDGDQSIYSHVVEGDESAAMDVLGDRLEQMRNHITDALGNADGYRSGFGKEESPCYRA